MAQHGLSEAVCWQERSKGAVGSSCVERGVPLCVPYDPLGWELPKLTQPGGNVSLTFAVLIFCLGQNKVGMESFSFRSRFFSSAQLSPWLFPLRLGMHVLEGAQGRGELCQHPQLTHDTPLQPQFK